MKQMTYTPLVNAAEKKPTKTSKTKKNKITGKKKTTPTKLNKINKKEEEKKEEVQLSEEEKDALRRHLAAQMVDHTYAPVSHDTLSKSVTYVTASNGLFKVRRTPVALFKEQVAKTDNDVPGLEKMEEGVELGIPKLPFRYLMEALSFYRDVNDKDGTEASVLFFYNHNNVSLPDVPGIREEDKFITYVPEQVNSGTLSDFSNDPWVDWLRENTALLLESHSH